MKELYHYTVDGLVEAICDVDELFDEMLAHPYDSIVLPIDDDILPF